MAFILKDYVEIFEIYMVKFNVTILNRPEIMKFSKNKGKNVIFIKTVGSLFTIYISKSEYFKLPQLKR